MAPQQVRDGVVVCTSPCKQLWHGCRWLAPATAPLPILPRAEQHCLRVVPRRLGGYHAGRIYPYQHPHLPKRDSNIRPKPANLAPPAGQPTAANVPTGAFKAHVPTSLPAPCLHLYPLPGWCILVCMYHVTASCHPLPRLWASRRPHQGMPRAYAQAALLGACNQEAPFGPCRSRTHCSRSLTAVLLTNRTPVLNVTIDNHTS